MLCILTSDWVLHTLFAGQNFFSSLKQVFPSFYITNGKKEEKVQKTKKYMSKKGLSALSATLKHWLTPKSWSTPKEMYAGRPPF